MTLIEVIVVIAILGVLIALLLPAIQSARLSATKMQAFNGGRQLLLATHQYAANNKDQLVDYEGVSPWAGASIIWNLCPYLEADITTPPAFLRLQSDPSNGPTAQPRFPMPVPVDPTDEFLPLAPSSFAFNAVCYAAGQRLNKTITDGLSSTIGLSEHYGSCKEATFESRFVGSVKLDATGKPRPQTRVSIRRTTFADYPMYDDVRPLTTTRDGQPTTIPNRPVTFQVRPALDDCDPRQPQSSLPGGILAGMLDGSVKFINPHVSQEVFWGSVTPAGGEVVNLD